MAKKTWSPIFENGICKVPVSHGQFALIDAEDYDKVKDYNWNSSSNGYVTAGSGKNRVILARLIMDNPEGLLIDHKFHNKLDNRKSQLRVCNLSENGWNTRGRSHNTSGVTGVGFRKSVNKFYAKISVNRKSIWLGLFKKMEDAIQARKLAEKEYFKEFQFKV